jgi:hypothetical protein
MRRQQNKALARLVLGEINPLEPPSWRISGFHLIPPGKHSLMKSSASCDQNDDAESRGPAE